MTNENRDATGQYDMVLCMSQDSINQQFRELCDDGLVKNTWSMRYAIDKRDDIVEGSIVVNENLPEDQNPPYDEVLELFDAGIGLHKEEKNKRVGFVAEIGAPYIQLLKDIEGQVAFCIPFKRGQMVKCYMWDDDPDIVPIDGAIFAFRVKLDDMSIPFEDATGIRDIVKKLLQQRINEILQRNEAVNGPKLTSKDFLMESLFLNLENAQFMAYDSCCVIPPSLDNPKAWESFVDVLRKFCQYYLAKSDTPYVLGYNIVVPPVKSLPDALFQPNCLYYSRTFVAQNNPGPGQEGDSAKSTLNYLMMIGKNKKPEDPDTGRVPGLVNKYDVLAIDGDLFYQNYLGEIQTNLVDKLNECLQSLNNNSFFGEGGHINPFGQSDKYKTVIDRNQKLKLPDVADFNSLMTTPMKLGQFKASAETDSMSAQGQVVSGKKLGMEVVYSPVLYNYIASASVDSSNTTMLMMRINFPANAGYWYRDYGNWGTLKSPVKAGASNCNENHGPPYILIYVKPGKDGKISTVARAVEKESWFLTSGAQKTINTVKKSIITPKPFSTLQSDANLKKIVQFINDTWPDIGCPILPNGNIFQYKAIDAVGAKGLQGKSPLTAITFQSTYNPQFDI